MDGATDSAVISPAAEGHMDCSVSRDDLISARDSAVDRLRQRRYEVATWLIAMPLDRLDALLPKNKACLELLDVFAEGMYDAEEWQEKERKWQEEDRNQNRYRLQLQRCRDIVRAIEDATDLSVGLLRELTEFIANNVYDLEIDEEFHPTYLRTPVTARKLLPSSFGDQINAMYYKYGISSTHPFARARPLIELGSSRWGASDLERNNIVSNLLGGTTVLPETMGNFMESVVNAKRTLYFKTSDKLSRQLLAELHVLVGEDFFNQHYLVLHDDDGVGDVAKSLNELALLYYGVSVASSNVQSARALGSNESLNEFYQDAICVSPLIDQVWGIDRGYNRNESSPFPIMFMVKSEQKKQQYHYYPEADIKVSGPIGCREFFKFLCECKPSSGDTSSHLHYILKLCWMSFHNLHQATYKQKKEVRQAAVFPSMFHANGIMKLFLCGFCATEQVHFFCARQYDSGVFHEALQLMHNMFNLRDHQYGVKSLEDNQEEVALQSFLKTALGKNLNLTQEPSGNSTQESSGTLGSNPVGTLKRPRESTGDDSGRATPSKRPRTDGATESEAEMPSERFFPEIDDYVKFMFNADTVCRQRGIMINRVDGSFEIVPPNRQVRTAEWRGKPIVLKFVPHRSTELSFLLLLNSDHMRSRPGNRTIELLNHFAVDDEFDCLMLPRVSMFDEAPALTPSEMLSLAQQARGYAAFLESVGLVHRDLKLENVGFLPGRTGTGAGDTGAQLAVLDLGRMERRDPSDLVREYYVPRNCCPPEFFQSSEGCSPFVMDAFAAGVIATELENRANAHPTTTTRLSVGAEEVAAASSVHDHETA